MTVTSAKTSSSPNQTIEPLKANRNGFDQYKNYLDERLLWGTLGLVAVLILIFRVVDLVHKHLRHVSTTNDAEQIYWAKFESTWLPKLKKHILYAPLWKRRHHAEFQLSSATSYGTLPSRLHTILLGIFFLSNLAYCAGIDYNLPNRHEVLAQLRGRTGGLAVANMIALVVFAGRNNPLMFLLQIGFPTYNLFHRWVGRVVVVEIIIHVIAWAVAEPAGADWESVISGLHSESFLRSGVTSATSMALLFLISPSIFRHAFYEALLNAHIVLVVVAFVGIWIHCDIGQLPQLPYIQIVVALWAFDRLARLLRTLWYNYPRKGLPWTEATLQPLPGETCRVTLRLPTGLIIKPGTHAYLRFMISPWESHPFSVAWLEDITHELPLDEKPRNATTSTDVSFVIRARSGLTRRLYDKANSSPGVRMLASFEGPYGGSYSLSSYGSCVLFAGAIGIAYQLSFVRYLINGNITGTVATRRISLVWIITDVECLSWAWPWLDEILSLPSGDVLNIEVYLTRPKRLPIYQGPDARVMMFSGRPSVRSVVEQQVNNQIGAMCISVCGPGSLADDVREAVREVQEYNVVDFVEECFTW